MRRSLTHPKSFSGGDSGGLLQVQKSLICLHNHGIQLMVLSVPHPRRQLPKLGSDHLSALEFREYVIQHLACDRRHRTGSPFGEGGELPEGGFAERHLDARLGGWHRFFTTL
jgi:hypothetical protein